MVSLGLPLPLTLTNRLRQCAAGTGRCTATDEESPPEKQTAFVCKGNFASKSWKPIFVCHTHTHTVGTNTAYLVKLQNSSSSHGLPTDLAYFLEVELRHGMEPVSQLSEVEKLHLKPEPQTGGERGGRERGVVETMRESVIFIADTVMVSQSEAN